jgi:hypothetical protein
MPRKAWNIFALGARSSLHAVEVCLLVLVIIAGLLYERARGPAFAESIRPAPAEPLAPRSESPATFPVLRFRVVVLEAPETLTLGRWQAEWAASGLVLRRRGCELMFPARRMSYTSAGIGYGFPPRETSCNWPFEIGSCSTVASSSACGLTTLLTRRSAERHCRPRRSAGNSARHNGR